MMAQLGWSTAASTTQHVPHDSALSVGSSSAASSKQQEEDAARIRGLEDEVRILAEKANAASQRFADYENEIRVLEARLRQEQRKNSAAVPTIPEAGDTPAQAAAVEKAAAETRPGISRFGSFIGGSRKATPAAAVKQNGTTADAQGREKELEERLVKEQTTRIAAEKKVKEVNAEIEDLSATLFQQANEMVAAERKENAGLKMRIQALEQREADLQSAPAPPPDDEKLQRENTRLRDKIRALEQRETDRKRRIERLEAANRRIERVRTMLRPP